MYISPGFLLALGFTPFSQLVCAAPTGGGGLRRVNRDVLTRFAEEGVSDVGIGGVHPIASDEEQVEQDLVQTLQTDDQITGEAFLFLLLMRQEVAVSC